MITRSSPWATNSFFDGLVVDLHHRRARQHLDVGAHVPLFAGADDEGDKALLFPFFSI